ncbi:MAG: hypothetical protein AB7G44_08255 [Bacteroidia bacterium]
MKKINFLLVVVCIVLFTSCNKEALQAKGDVMFWYNSVGTDATVLINGQTGFITQYYSGVDPNCNANGCANFNLPTGTYNYSASSTFSSWSGSVTVTNNGCTKVLLQ